MVGRAAQVPAGAAAKPRTIVIRGGECDATMLRGAIILAAIAALASVVWGAGDYPWIGNDLGRTDAAPAPWTPVEVDGPTVRVWGRDFTWAGGPLPAQITSQGVPLLAAPIDLGLSVGGAALALPEAPVQVTARTEGAVGLRWGGAAAGVDLRAAITVEFDGFTRIALTLAPERPVAVERWELRLPVAPAVAQVFSRYLNYDFAALRTDKQSFATSLRFIEAPIDEPFNPEVWVGNAQVGLTWAAQTNLPWQQADFERAISVIPGEGATDLVVRFIDHPVTLTEPMTVEFALSATPLKPFDPRMRQIRLGHPSRLEGALRAGASREGNEYYGVGFPNDFRGQWDSIPFPEDSDEARAYRERLRSAGVRLIPYGALAFTNAVYEPPRRYYAQWHTLPVSQATLGRFAQYDAGVTEDLGKPLIGHWDGYRVCMTPESYHDFFVDMWVRALTEYEMDGIYLDHGEVSHGCQNPGHEHYLDPRTQPGKYFYGIFGARECLKRLWVAAKQADPDTVIELHQSRPSRIFNSFLDICLSGEVINVFFCGEHTSRDVIADPSLYVPDYDTLPPAFFAMEFRESYGFDSRILPEVKFANEQYLAEHPELDELWTRVLIKNVLLAGARMHAGNMNQGVLDEYFRGLDAFGPMTDEVAMALAADGQELAVPTRASTRVTVYHAPGRALVIAGNDAAQDADERIALALPEQLATARDAISGEAVAVAEGALAVTVPARTYRMIVLAP